MRNEMHLNSGIWNVINEKMKVMEGLYENEVFITKRSIRK